MTDYTKAYNKSTGDVVNTSEFSSEFDLISTAVNTKADSAGDTITGAFTFSNALAIDLNGKQMVLDAGGNTAIQAAVDNIIKVRINSADRHTLTQTVLGIGNTSPNTWASQFTALQLGGNAVLWAHTTAGVTKALRVGQNVYNDGSYRYISTDQASYYSQINGTHDFNVAPSGTAGTTISWTTALTLNNDGSTTIPNVNITGGTIAGVTLTGITDLAVAEGGTGSSSASGARTNLGLGNAATFDTGTLVSDLATGDRGVSNGNTHNHDSGDGGAITTNALGSGVGAYIQIAAATVSSPPTTVSGINTTTYFKYRLLIEDYVKTGTSGELTFELGDGTTWTTAQTISPLIGAGHTSGWIDFVVTAAREHMGQAYMSGSNHVPGISTALGAGAHSVTIDQLRITVSNGTASGGRLSLWGMKNSNQ